MPATMSPSGHMTIWPAGNSLVAVDLATPETSGLILHKTNALQSSISRDGSWIAKFEPFQISIHSSKDGQSVRDFAVAERFPWGQIEFDNDCQPVPIYFENPPIPPRLLKTKYHGIFGKSKLQETSGLRFAAINDRSLLTISPLKLHPPLCVPLSTFLHSF